MCLVRGTLGLDAKLMRKHLISLKVFLVFFLSFQILMLMLRIRITVVCLTTPK
ncbi:hypothetical protein U1Q18_032123, partial [Sarracenia purpurea var. burkii]